MQNLVRFVVWTAVILGLILGALRAVAIRWFWLPTDDPVFEASISPTLAGGDLIVAARVTRPRFGDLVVCPEPGAPERYIIGRIVGEAGDSVRIDDGKVFTNDRGFSPERSCDPPKFSLIDPNTDQEVEQFCHFEAIANHVHMTGDLRGFRIRPEAREFHVDEGMYFLLSDNRLYPYDSRDYGLVEVDSCKETVVLRIVSEKGWMDVSRRLDYIQ